MLSVSAILFTIGTDGFAVPISISRRYVGVIATDLDKSFIEIDFSTRDNRILIHNSLDIFRGVLIIKCIYNYLIVFVGNCKRYL